MGKTAVCWQTASTSSEYLSQDTRSPNSLQKKCRLFPTHIIAPAVIAGFVSKNGETCNDQGLVETHYL